MKTPGRIWIKKSELNTLNSDYEFTSVETVSKTYQRGWIEYRAVKKNPAKKMGKKKERR